MIHESYMSLCVFELFSQYQDRSIFALLPPVTPNPPLFLWVVQIKGLRFLGSFVLIERGGVLAKGEDKMIGMPRGRGVWGTAAGWYKWQTTREKIHPLAVLHALLS